MDASFRHAFLAGASFAGAKLARTQWSGCQGLDKAWIQEGWRHSGIQQLLVTGNGLGEDFAGQNLMELNLSGAKLVGANFTHADLTGVSLAGADLRQANLAESQALGADFRGADLTGACLRDWSIDPNTFLEGVRCRYFFLSEKEDPRTGLRERRPHDPDRFFEDGDFEKLFRHVQDTIDLLIRKGVDRADFAHALRTMMALYPETQGTIRSVEQVDGDLVVRLNRDRETDAVGVEQSFYQALESRQIEGTRRELLPASPVDPVMVRTEPIAKASVFLSYSHRDPRRFEECRLHLTTLERNGMAEIWHDNRINEGDDWEAAIDERLANADIVLLLISPAFIASDFCFKKEMPAALAQRPKTTVIPVVVESCEMEGLPFHKLQMARQGKPIDSRNRNKAWTEVVRAVREAIVNRAPQARGQAV